MTLRFAAALAMALAGCVPKTMPDDVKFEARYTADPKTMAECFYRAMDAIYPTQMKLTALPESGAMLVAREDGAARYWQARFADGNPGTLVELRTANAVWGRDFYTGQAAPALEHCGST